MPFLAQSLLTKHIYINNHCSTGNSTGKRKREKIIFSEKKPIVPNKKKKLKKPIVHESTIHPIKSKPSNSKNKITRKEKSSSMVTTSHPRPQPQMQFVLYLVHSLQDSAGKIIFSEKRETRRKKKKNCFSLKREKYIFLDEKREREKKRERVRKV